MPYFSPIHSTVCRSNQKLTCEPFNQEAYMDFKQPDSQGVRVTDPEKHPVNDVCKTQRTEAQALCMRMSTEYPINNRRPKFIFKSHSQIHFTIRINARPRPRATFP